MFYGKSKDIHTKNFRLFVKSLNVIIKIRIHFNLISVYQYVDLLFFRDSGQGEVEPICSIHPQTFKPRAMLNAQLEWRWVINVKNFEQTFRSDICLK